MASLEMSMADIEDDDELKEVKLQLIKLMPLDLSQFSLDPGELIECVSENVTIKNEHIEKIF